MWLAAAASNQLSEVYGNHGIEKYFHGLDHSLIPRKLANTARKVNVLLSVLDGTTEK